MVDWRHLKKRDMIYHNHFLRFSNVLPLTRLSVSLLDEPISKKSRNFGENTDEIIIAFHAAVCVLNPALEAR